LNRVGILGTLLVVELFILSGTTIVEAGTEMQPEFLDDWNDTLDQWDIISAWFYESGDDKQILTVKIQMHEINYIERSTVLIKFKCDDIEYYVNTTISFLGIPRSTLAIHTSDWMNIPIKSNVDFDRNRITCKIPKSVCDNLNCGSLLTDTFVSAGSIHCQYLNQYCVLYSLLHDTSYGKDYRILY